MPYAGYSLGLGDTLALRLLLDLLDIFGDSLCLSRRSEFVHEFAFRSEHHECCAVDGIHARSEDGDRKMLFTVDGVEHHLGTFGLADPVALHFLEGVRPGQFFEAVEETAGIGRHAQLPLRHLLLLHGEAAAHGQAVLDLIVGQDRAQAFAPVDRSLALVSDAVVHQSVGFLLFGHGIPFLSRELQIPRAGGVRSCGALCREACLQFLDRTGFLQGVVIPTAEHLQESPLGPLVESGVAGADLTVPVIREAYAVELAAIAVDVFGRGLLGMLTGLDGVLLGRQAEGVISHRVEDIVAGQTFVA